MARDSTPQPDVPLFTQAGGISKTWYDYFLSLKNGGSGQDFTAAIEALQRALAGKQPLNANLSAISVLVGAGFLRRDENGTWSLSGLSPDEIPNPFATYLVDENGDYLTDLSGNYLVSDDGIPVPVEYGGTGATTAAGARTNLGAADDTLVVHLAGSESITGDKTNSGLWRFNTNSSPVPFAYGTTPLVIQAANDVEPSLFFHGYYSLGTINNGVNLSTRVARGTGAAPAAVQVGDHLGGVICAGYGTSYVNAGRLGWQSRSTWTGSNAENRFFLQTTPSGSATPVSRVYVEPDGTFIVNPNTPNTSTSAGGKFQAFSTAAGSAAPLARLVNTSGTASSAVEVSLDPGDNGFNVRDCILQASNSGGNAITFKVRNANGAAPADCLTVGPTGNTTAAGYIKTAAPTTGTSGDWKLGVRVAAAVALDTTQYIQLDIGGTLYKLAIVT